MSIIANDTVVQFNYTLTNSDGDVLGVVALEMETGDVMMLQNPTLSGC